MKFSKVRKSKHPVQACIWTNSIALEQLIAKKEIKSKYLTATPIIAK